VAQWCTPEGLEQRGRRAGGESDWKERQPRSKSAGRRTGLPRTAR